MKKHAKYEDVKKNYICLLFSVETGGPWVPFSVETVGPWVNEATDILRKIGKQLYTDERRFAFPPFLSWENIHGNTEVE